MKNLSAIILSLYISLFVIGQPDTLYLTINQKKTLESMIDRFEEKKMDLDEIYLENKRFDSLIRIIDKMNDSKHSSVDDKNSVYRIAKTIYPYSWEVSFWENPTGCFLGNDIIERTQERLRDFCNLCEELRATNEFGLTQKQLYQVHVKQMDGYLMRLKHAFHFIDKNLEGRLWAHLYFGVLEKTHLIILAEQK
ncbi:hypothetical protein [Brumimicrobium mesophilum]|uniref:hypothetical protein n=1 Tax=Brumimicrobium mesophilum TaxID=392717 RepID=UPI000D140537|nr:hypothetical protein [Brumimicrobium mesophilum]